MHRPRPGCRGRQAPGSPPDALFDLQQRLVAALEGLGFPAEARAYRPHVTLARKVGGQAQMRGLPALAWEVRELSLVESLAGAAPHYRPIARWPLD